MRTPALTVRPGPAIWRANGPTHASLGRAVALLGVEPGRLAVYLAQHDINAADDRHHIGHQMAAAEVVQGAQVVE